MIPKMNILAWGNTAPWVELHQIEQDLIISRALVSIFSDSFLKQELRFRGGTALNKLHFPMPLRYSEDIDLVRTTSGGIGPILDQLRVVLRPWLGEASLKRSPIAPKLLFNVPAENDPNLSIRLKIEINIQETEVYDSPLFIPFAIQNPWFTGQADIPTFSHEEMLATKLRALLQRDKGRDLYDLAHALEIFTELNDQRVVECFELYLQKDKNPIRRAEAEQRMFAKLAKSQFQLLMDMKPLLAQHHAQSLTEESTKNAFINVFFRLVTHLSGEPWVKTPEYQERWGIYPIHPQAS